MNLEAIAEALAVQKPESPMAMIDAEEVRLERFGNIAFTGFAVVILVAVAAIIFLIITRMILSGTQPWTGALLTAFIVFAALTLGYVFWRESIKEKRAALLKKGRANLAAQDDPDQAQLNPSSFEPVPSVTERTTRELSARPRHRE